jgi:hypothetical protein
MLTETDLSQFIGTSQYYTYMAGLKLTDGVKYLADNAGNGCYWLLDIIASYQTDAKIRREPFQIWELKLTPKAEGNPHAQPCVVTMKTDTNQPNLVRQEIPYTDFPLDSITLYLIDGVILLTSEY